MTPLKMLLNSYHSGANAWFALAQERGYFADEGLEVTFVPGNGAYRAPRMLAEGGFDLTFGDMGSLIALAAESAGDAPTAIHALHHRSPCAIAVPLESAIRAPGDLTGRKMIGHLSDVALRCFPAYASVAGLDTGGVDVEISNDTMAQMLQAMMAGAADGVFGYISSQRAVLRQVDPALAARLRFLPFPDVVPDLYGSAIIASRHVLENEPQAVRAFLKAMNLGLLEAVRDIPAAVDAVLKRKPDLDRDIEIDRWTGTIGDEFNHPEAAVLGFGAMDPARLDRGAELLARSLALARTPTADDLFDSRFLPAREARMAVAEACRMLGARAH